MTETICAIVVTHNRLAQLKITVARLLEEDVEHVIVVNNCSSDGTQKWLDEQPSQRLTAMNLDENRGGAGGFEAGMRHATNAFGSEWLLLMDDDARPKKGAIYQFRKSDLSNTGIVAAAVFTPTGEICEMNRPWRNPFKSISIIISTARAGRKGFHLSDCEMTTRGDFIPIDGGSFVGLFLRQSLVKRQGYPDGRLFIYGDDVLYTLAATKAGEKALLLPSVIFEHDTKTGSTAGVFQPLWKNFYRFRNQLFVYRLAAGPILSLPVSALMILKWCAMGFKVPTKNRSLYFKILRRAIVDAIQNQRNRSHANVLRDLNS